MPPAPVRRASSFKSGVAISSPWTTRSLPAACGAATGSIGEVDAICIAPDDLFHVSRQAYYKHPERSDFQEGIMAVRIGDEAPDFTAQTTEGTIRFHDWIGDKWAVLFSHPKDFTPVCTTELGYLAKLKPEFDKRNTKVIGLSIDPVEDHKRWAKDIEETQGTAPNYPIIGDADLVVAKLYDMIHPNASGAQPRTPADNATIRSVFIVGPDKKIKLNLTYPMTTGRNFDEVLRVLDSLQLTAKHKVATPAQWKPGEDVIIAGSVSNDEAKIKYPGGWKSPKPYLRIVPQPK
jgi:alkyl hydroperoxide reductase subunit AhpC